MDSENSNATSPRAEGDTTRTQFSCDGSVEPSTAVAEAVATVTGREPTELEPIHRSIDTDALNSLVVPVDLAEPRTIQVSFRYEGVDVLVDSDCTVEVRTPPE